MAISWSICNILNIWYRKLTYYSAIQGSFLRASFFKLSCTKLSFDQQMVYVIPQNWKSLALRHAGITSTSKLVSESWSQIELNKGNQLRVINVMHAKMSLTFSFGKNVQKPQRVSVRNYTVLRLGHFDIRVWRIWA